MIMPAAGTGWMIQALFTVAETVQGYRPVGILDGIGAIALDSNLIRIFVNHEVNAEDGYAYALANGTELTGARVSYFDIDNQNRNHHIVHAGLAYHTVIDRAGNIVTDPGQINEGNTVGDRDGFDRFCSSGLFTAGEYGLVDAIYLTGEEAGSGVEYALDVRNRVIHAAPHLGRAAWENATLVETGSDDTVGVIVGDDRAGAPLLLHVGRKNAIGDGSFLDRNGLARGDLLVWVADDGSLSPEDFNGTGNSKTGTFVVIPHYDPAMAGQPGYDELGYVTQARQDDLVAGAGGFQFSRPEDVSTNPDDGYQFVMASTGRGSAYPSDNWGTTYIIELDFSGPDVVGTVSIAYDGDDAGAGQFSDPDYGLRSPDNLDWADNGMIYLQEDRSTSPGSLFGGVSGMEASLWELDPQTGILTRVAEIDRSAVPTGQMDPIPGVIGNWESSGVLDVTELFTTEPGEVLLIADVQAHSLVGEPLGAPNQSQDLVQGGQLIMVSRQASESVAHSSASESRLDPNGSKPLASPAASHVALRAAPNPLASGTTITFQLEAPAGVSASVYGASGRLVRILASETMAAGRHTLAWDRTDTAHRPVESGVYFLRIVAADAVQHRKLIVLR
ncbi:MAG: DUF839 domain-containing protein [Candidatus Eiseniibacteriota bacterium]